MSSTHQGMMAAGCGVDSVVILANEFMVPSSNLPGVVVFMSTNEGEPGYREYVQGSVSDLASSIPGITLVTAPSFFELLDTIKNVSHVTITADAGPWSALRYSTALKIYIIVFATIYGLMILICSVLAIRVFMGTKGWLPTQQRFWMYFGIVYCFLGVTFRLTLNYADLSDTIPYWVSFAILMLSAYTFIAIIYVFVLYSWVDLCSKIDAANNIRLISRLASVYRVICIMANFFFILTFILAVIYGTVPILPSWFVPVYNIITILKYTFWILVPVGFLIFGTFLVLSLRKTGIDSMRNRLMSRKILILMVTMGLAQILWFTANYVAQNMATTVSNFWISRISGDITNILSSIVMVVVLKQPSIVSNDNTQQSSRSKVKSSHNQEPFDITNKRHTWTKMDDIELQSKSETPIVFCR